MPDEIIIKQCSPTLAGIKTGNLFPADFINREEMIEDMRSLNRRLCSKGVRVLPMRFDGNKALIYLYRPKKLLNDIKNPEATSLLKEMGYGGETPEKCLALLMEKLKDNEEFPHEIGLFLGYPPEDVRGFIENRASSCKCVGTWKVYGDEEKAKKTFSQFKKCSNLYYEQWQKGKSIESLAV